MGVGVMVPVPAGSEVLGVSLASGVQVGALVRDGERSRTDLDVAVGGGSVSVGEEVAVRNEVGSSSGGNGFKIELGLLKRV